jgi:oligoendopeptidase F
MFEGGTPLTREGLDQVYGELHETYLPGVAVDERVRAGWSRIPHFYRAFYVYQYATGMSSAINIARAVRDEGEPAQRRYLEMLSSGGSDYPMNILRRAGVDLTQREPLQVAMTEFESTIAEMEELATQGVLEEAAKQAAAQAGEAQDAQP